jgi:transcriptional regulator with XRE-family HTH domain
MAKHVKALPTPPQAGPIDQAKLAQFIKAKRTQSGLKVEDAALLCGISKATYTKIEKGDAAVSFQKVLHVCSMLGIELFVKAWDE